MPSLRSVPFAVDRKLIRKRFTHAVTLNNLPSLLNLPISTTVEIPDLVVTLAIATFTFFSSSTLCGVSLISETGHSSLGPDNQVGPHHHNSFFFSLEASSPLEPISAGFCSPGQCAQSSFGVILKMSFTRWRTNCFHSPLLLIHQSAVLLSSHWRELFISTPSFKAFCTVSISFANTLPDINSSLGIVCIFSGATLVLDVSSITEKAPYASHTK